ncbi:type IV pilus assembly protein FimV [Duganella sp. P38]|uniref:type IV pilus assembly protein FimV n=1 Tax=Duganella sp. P38 TaxID=3423949 RepID=UPI003D7A9DAD
MQHKLLTLLICSWLGAVQAAELGDVAPRSYIGQPLAADIDLLALTPDELANLQVRLADANVYRGANVAMNPALATVRVQVERRGQKPVLHVTTTRPVEADYVHLYLRLGAPGRQDVRLATVWLQPDPNPAPPPQPAVPPASTLTPAQAEQIAAQARATRETAARDAALKEAASKASAAKEGVAKEAARDAAAPTKEGVSKEVAARDAVAPSKEGAVREAARDAAAPVKEAAAKAASDEAARQAAAAPVRDRSKPAPLPSMHEAETGTPGEVKAAAAARRIAGVWVTADGKPTRAPTSADAAPVPEGVAQALLPLAPLPLPKGVKRPAPRACAPTGMSAKECQALDAHNAELSSKLVELEGKMRALQGALGGAAPAALAAASKATPASDSPATAASPAAKAGVAPGAAAASGATSSNIAASSNVGPSGAMSATASLSTQAAPEAHAAKATAGEGASAQPGAGAADKGGKTDGAHSAVANADSVAGAGAASASGASPASAASVASAASAASGEAGAADAAAAAPVATKQVRVLPKLKYKKEKPPEPQTDYTLPLVAGGVGLLALLGAGFFWWRKKKSGKGPLKIWQGFRKKKAPDAAPTAAEPAGAPAAPASAPAAAATAMAEPVAQ